MTGKSIFWNDPIILICIGIISVLLVATTQYYISINDGSAYQYCLWNIEMVNHTVTQHDIDWCSGVLP